MVDFDAMLQKKRQERVRLGWEAMMNGQPIHDNPFSHAPESQSYKDWEAGWEAASKAVELEG